MVTVRIANAPIYNGELLTTIGGSSEFLSAVSTQVQSFLSQDFAKKGGDLSPPPFTKLIYCEQG
jgi:hypothetical protein